MNKIMILFASILPFPLILLAHLYFKQNKISKVGKVVYLNSGREHTGFWLNSIHWVIEKLIFIRVDSYKNYPRGNFLWIRSFLHVSLLYIAIYLLSVFIIGFEKVNSIYTPNAITDANAITNANENFIKAAAVFFGLVCTFYWQEKTKYKDKWVYLANFYNEILKNWSSKSKHDLMSNALAIDAVTTMMWNHRSFSNIVYVELKSSIENLVDPTEAKTYLDKFLNDQLTETEALWLLEKRQGQLIKKYPAGWAEVEAD